MLAITCWQSQGHTNTLNRNRLYVKLQGEVVAISMLNAVVAACAQVGDLARAFETFEVRWLCLLL